MESYFGAANKEETTTKEKMTAKETKQETTAKEDTTCKEDMAAKEDMDAKEDPASMEVAIMKKVEEVKEEEPSVSVPQIAEGSGTDSRPADARSVSFHRQTRGPHSRLLRRGGNNHLDQCL